MKKNNFFMATVLGIIALLGTSFELRSSEKSDLAPYIIGGSVIVIGAGLLAGTKTATYQTYSKHKVRLAEEKEVSQNPLVYPEKIPVIGSGEKEGERRMQAFFNGYEAQRRAEAQKCAKKITENTLPSHIIDDYAGEHRK
jgi:hypothetical protein